MTAILSKPRDSFITDAHSPSVPVPSFEEDEFPHGWRRITETLPDGSVRYRDIPLSPEDFLNPEFGDQMPQGFEHSIQAIDIYNKLKKHYHGNPGVKVLSDTKIRWGIPGLKEPFPDIAVIPDVGDVEIIEGSFDVVKHMTRPCLIIEVMSPNYAGDDTDKVEICEQAGICEYIILDHHPEDRSLPFELTGCRLVRGEYRDIIPGSDGMVLSETTGIRFGLGASGRVLVLRDAVTGEELLSDENEYHARVKAEIRAESEAARADQAEGELSRVRAELARLRSDT
ncbi:MAG: Uma2 family endonuclease [Desulfobacteraceae bacterium]|nr:Uma2 family endonuclease [Desulfobacteraceae bacterium]